MSPFPKKGEYPFKFKKKRIVMVSCVFVVWNQKSVSWRTKNLRSRRKSRFSESDRGKRRDLSKIYRRQVILVTEEHRDSKTDLTHRVNV